MIFWAPIPVHQLMSKRELVTMSFGTLVPVHKLVGGVRGVNKVEILGSISVNQLAYDLNLPYLVACGSAMAHHMDW